MAATPHDDETAPVVTIVRTGVANTASVAAALRRAGATPVITAERAEIEAAARLVLPGVGAFASGMSALREAGLVEPLRARLADGRPTLAICLGMQVLFESSAESPGVRGLGVLPGRFEAFPAGVRTPQFGWNRIASVDDTGSPLIDEPGFVYFANSFRLASPADFSAELPADVSACIANHGGPFVAAVERGGLLACQFHAELSGAFGLRLIRRWLAAGADDAAARSDAAAQEVRA
jgi:imidazole glycerol phosphate synthase glutamine amidotransferase subunit